MTFLARLLKLRTVVARFGELDGAQWWNTSGQLGRLGALALRRGFPRTHYFAQSRAVFAVAAHRCRELHNAPGSYTLWSLPDAIEESFDAAWEGWLDRATEWKPFFELIQALPGKDLAAALVDLDLVTPDHVQESKKLRRAAGGRTVPIRGPFTGEDRDLSLLALGFALGEPRAPAVPYIE